MRPARAESARDLPLRCARASECCRPGRSTASTGRRHRSAAAKVGSMLPWVVLGAASPSQRPAALIALQVMPGQAATHRAQPIATMSRQLRRSHRAGPADFAPAAAADIPAPIAPYAPDRTYRTYRTRRTHRTRYAPSSSLEDVVSRSIPAIVSIEAGQGRGSGFFAAPRTVITNRHVVQDNVSVTVRLSNGPDACRDASRSSSTGIRSRDRARRQRHALAAGAAARHRQRGAARTGSDRHRPCARRVSEQRDARHHQRRPARRSYGDAADRRRDQPGQQRRAAAEPPAAGRRHQHDEDRRRSRVARLRRRRRSRARLLSGGGAIRQSVAASAQPSQPLAPAFGARSSTDHRPRRRHAALRRSSSRPWRARRCSSTRTGTASRRTVPCASRPDTTVSGSACGTAARR